MRHGQGVDPSQRGYSVNITSVEARPSQPRQRPTVVIVRAWADPARAAEAVVRFANGLARASLLTVVVVEGTSASWMAAAQLSGGPCGVDAALLDLGDLEQHRRAEADDLLDDLLSRLWSRGIDARGTIRCGGLGRLVDELAVAGDVERVVMVVDRAPRWLRRARWRLRAHRATTIVVDGSARASDGLGVSGR